VIDKSPNPDLGNSVREIIMNLNPLDHASGLSGFAAELSGKIERSVIGAGCCGIECFVQAAAVCVSVL
jgi:hypothetical protein